MYSDFDADLEITSVKTKTFEENQLNLSFIYKQQEVNTLSRVVEEFVLKNKKKWVNARVVGVEVLIFRNMQFKKALNYLLTIMALKSTPCLPSVILVLGF